jgi:transketolase
VWEAALSAGKHRLTSLTVIVDYNRFLSYNRDYEVQELEPLRDKWRSFGFGVAEVDGHDIDALRDAFRRLPLETDKPSAIICHTVKGKGLRATENNPDWHHKARIDDEELARLYAELEVTA